MFLLYFQDECLGEIQDINTEGMWMYGKLIPNQNIVKFKDFFKALTSEENDFKESEYNEEWLKDDNWFIVDDHQNKRGIHLPAVYEDGEINWRWR